MAAMEPLLYAAGADILLSGHVHAYERSVCSNCNNLFAIFNQIQRNTYPTICFIGFQERAYNGRLDPCGAVHITIGDGGNREGLAQRCQHTNI